MCDFKVGDEVVCVDDSPSFYTGQNLLDLGRVYTVEGFDDLPNGTNGEAGIFLAEVETPIVPGVGAGWSTNRFRKVQRRDLTEWLSSSVGNTDKIDKRKRVKA